MRRVWFAVCAVVLVAPAIVFTQAGSLRTASLPGDYRLDLDVSYPTDGTFQGKLDVYARKSSNPGPVIIWWHGSNADKEYMRWLIPPLLELGFHVVVPQGPDSPASPSLRTANREARRIPAGRCVLRWTNEHAADYRFDVNRIVVAGVSLGGYTALMSALIDSRAGFDQPCPGQSEPRVAAIVDFFGPIRLPDGTEGDSLRIQPLTYVRKDQPPVFVAHGDADPQVPYAHSVELSQALERAGIAHEFLTIPGGKHGLVTWEPEQLRLVWARLGAFFAKHALLPQL